MDRDEIRRFALRDWGATEAADDAYNEATYLAGGPATCWNLAAALRAHLVAVNPTWPTPEDRAADLDAHLLLKKALERTRGAVGRR